MNYNIVTFSYHDVCDDPYTSGFNRESALPYKLSTKRFAKDIQAIKNSNIKPVKINKIKDLSSKHKILLTFDDGGKSAMYIADTLEKNECFGHFFITTSMIGSSLFLNKHEIKELFLRGHIIGTHSHTHPMPFRKLSYKKMLNEWKVSIDILNQIIDSKVVCASIPGGDMNSKTIKYASESNIKYLFTSEPFNKAWTRNDVIIFGRVFPKNNTKILEIENFANNKKPSFCGVFNYPRG